MTTDIDRLHRVLEMTHPPRRCGKTTAVCHLIAGVIELGERGPCALLSHMNDRVHFCKVLGEVLWEHGLIADVDPSLYHVRVHGDGVPDALIEIFVADFPNSPNYFPMWDARRHARPDLLDYEDYRRLLQHEGGST